MHRQFIRYFISTILGVLFLAVLILNFNQSNTDAITSKFIEERQMKIFDIGYNIDTVTYELHISDI